MSKKKGRTELTRLIQEGRVEEYAPLVEEDLEQIIKRRMHGQGVLDSRDILQELYLRLLDYPGQAVRDRYHFFCLAAQMSRRILANHARDARAQKRGRGLRLKTIEDNMNVAEEKRPTIILDIHLAIERLEKQGVDITRIVDLILINGCTREEAAEMMGKPLRTIEREWRAARLLLTRELGE